MNNPQSLKWKLAARMVFAALLALASPAFATLTVTAENQTGPVGMGPWAPTWVVNTNLSLIAGSQPSTVSGNFSLETQNGTRDVNTLTVNTNLTLFNYNNQTSGTTNYVTVGNGAGNLLVYTLPAGPANGYNLTNITYYGGWANNGRDAIAFTVLYSTVADPASFQVLTAVQYNPTVTAGSPTANRAIIADSQGGVIAANVAAVKFVFSVPTVENNYVGCAAILVGGQAAPSVVSPVISVTTSNQNGTPSPFTPSWAMELPNLISGSLPLTANGNFTLETSAGTSVLTDGLTGVSGDHTTLATCGGGSGSGSTLVYSLGSYSGGYDLTNIITYSGWGDNGRDGQYYNVSYSTVAAPTTYVPITTVYYRPTVAGSTPSANRVAIAMNNGTPLAQNAAYIKFEFATPPSAGSFNNGYQGYGEIIVQGSETALPPPPPSPYLTQDAMPAYAETVVGDQVIFTAEFSNAPPASLQWQFVSGSVTNDISGATSSTLTLNNVQVADSGSYRLKAVNATNGAAAPSYTAARTLVVNSLPAAVNGIIVKNATQRGAGAAGTSTNFYPTWTLDTASDLLFQTGFSDVGSGSFGDSSTASDPTLLTDGAIGYFNYWPNVGGSPTLVTCGNNRGQYVTYDLPASSYGYDITNITVYGGWGDAGRDEVKFEVLYSVDGSTFISIGTMDYNPANVPANTQSAARVMLVPESANGFLRNVRRLQFKFNTGSENGYSGYSEIVVGGKPSPAIPTLAVDTTPLVAVTVVGDQLTLQAAFNGADSYHWQRNGTNLVDGGNISGATTTSLTLSHLQLTDTATNGTGYRLAGINSSGAAYSTPCALTVNPVPAATNNVIVAMASQLYQHHVDFTPDWVVDTSARNLIYQLAPSATNGNFNLEPFGTTRDVAGLTDGGALTVGYVNAIDGYATASGNYVSCGNGSGLYNTERNTAAAGSMVVYTLPASANGYSLTNITVYGGWADAGRDQQAYTVLYSTVTSPTVFHVLATVNYNPDNPNGGTSATRSTITPAVAAMATNVAAVKFDFTFPTTENGFSGYGEITIGGYPSSTLVPEPAVITQENQTNTFTWTVETPNLIANQLPSSYGAGIFTEEGCNVTNLTDGLIGFGSAFGASCGADGIAVPYIIFSAATGWDLTNIVVYTLWHDYGRDGQFYDVSYSTLANPNTFIHLANVAYNPDVPHDGRATGNRVAISPLVGQTLLASNVAAVKFDFTSQQSQDFGWSGYSEIVLQGTALAAVSGPAISTVKISGSNLILAGAGGTPNAGYTVLTTTNLTTPLANWTVSTTGTLDGTGAFSNAIPVSATEPGSFYRVRVP